MVKFERPLNNLYSLPDLLEEFEDFENAQDTFIDSYVNTFSEELSEVTGIDAEDIEFTDILWKHAFIDFYIKTETVEKFVSFYNWNDFVHCGDTENDEYSKMILQLKDNLEKYRENNSRIKIKIRYEFNVSNDELRNLLLAELKERDEDEY